MADGLLELACNYSSDSHHSEGSDKLSPNKTDDLSDEYEEIIDDGPAVVSETPKSFLPELKLQNYFSSSAKQPSIEEKVNHAIKSNLSKIMPPKGHMSVWTDSKSEKDRIRRKLAEQKRRDQAKQNLQQKIRSSCRESSSRRCRCCF
jgi:hypothetical protein